MWSEGCWLVLPPIHWSTVTPGNHTAGNPAAGKPGRHHASARRLGRLQQQNIRQQQRRQRLLLQLGLQLLHPGRLQRGRVLLLLLQVQLQADRRRQRKPDASPVRTDECIVVCSQRS